ncbi:MAG: amidohydrolase family protein [Candidatus Hodarchaeales archaeon]
MKRILVRTRLMVPLSDSMGRTTRLEDGYILTEDNLIKEIGTFNSDHINELIKRCRKEKVVLQVVGGENEQVSNSNDIPQINGVALPGFVKAHGHDHESPIIGIGKDVPLTTWLDESVNLFTGFLHQKENTLTKRFGRSPYLLTYLKARIDDLQHGITTAVTHHCNFNKYHVPELVEANKLANTKIIIAVGAQDRHYDPRILDKPPEVAIKRMNDLYEQFKEEPNIHIIPGPDQLFSNGPELLKGLKQWANEHQTMIHIHSSEELATTEWFREEYGKTPIEYADSIDFLDKNTFVGHQVQNTDQDLEILAKTGTKVVHNPLANTILGSGIPPLQKFLNHEITFAISTDGSGSADNQNIINSARVAAQYQKAFHKNATLMQAQDVLERITVIPSEIIGKFNIGSLEVGKSADIVILDLSQPNLTPTRIDNVVENIIWAANGNEVKYLISNGELVINDYQFTHIDISHLLNQIQELSELFLKFKGEVIAQKATGVREGEQ